MTRTIPRGIVPALGLAILVCGGPAAMVALGADPVPTELTVRVIAAGAKWVSPELGGADVWVADAITGEVLARAQVEGDSGDTTALMDEQRTRSEPLPTTATSGRATLTVPLSEPRQLIVHASGPRLGDGPVASASASVWMVPGVDPGGDEGVVLEVYGLAVALLSPTPHEVITATDAVEVPVLAVVEMLCGCPIGPTTPWPPDDYEVEAVALMRGAEVARSTLAYGGEESRFSGSLELPGPGVYELLIIARQIDVANTGVARDGVVVSAPSSG
jgi:hypothetical protein